MTPWSACVVTLKQQRDAALASEAAQIERADTAEAALSLSESRAAAAERERDEAFKRADRFEAERRQAEEDRDTACRTREMWRKAEHDRDEERQRVWEEMHRQAERSTAAESRAERMRGALVELLGVDSPWPLADVLERLTDAVEHMLHDHDCDRHGWELDAGGLPRAEQYAAIARRLSALAAPTPQEGR